MKVATMTRLMIQSTFLLSSFFLFSVNAHNQRFLSIEEQIPSFVPTPVPSPTSNPSRTQAPQSYMYNDWNTTTSVDVLVAALFLIAAGWLVLAIIYSVLILIVVRMRARGEFDIYDENFGRLFLLGTRCYIPLGCILRRHVVAMQSRNRRQSLHIMTREERRRAMELILTQSGDREQDEEKSEESGMSERPVEEVGYRNEIAESDDEAMCSICLMEYEDGDVIFRSPSCVHRFHQDCLMDWLERRNHTECPCCRESMVSDEDVWETVQQLRREQRKLRRQEPCRNSFLGRIFGCARKHTASEESNFEVGQQLNSLDEVVDEEGNAGNIPSEGTNVIHDSTENEDAEEDIIGIASSNTHGVSIKESINEESLSNSQEISSDTEVVEEIRSGNVNTEASEAEKVCEHSH
mmetsp:Transcript_14060/g.21476  ORF Transcript_14060/g.21476 Transcript_14060/m.21476 type:complete len:407 (+) Transcript_14060:83-1303(+)